MNAFSRQCYLILASLVSLVSISVAQTLNIYHLDVGQGDATLMVAKDSTGVVSKSVLIDGGLKRYGQQIIDYATKTLHLTKLDYVIATHYDNDHVAGLAVVLNNGLPSTSSLVVDSVFDRGDSLYYDANKGKTYKTAARLYGGRRKTLIPGKTITLFDDSTSGTLTGKYTIKMYCICVNGYITGTPLVNLITGSNPDENDLSTGFLVSYSKFKYLTCGDIGGKHGNQPGTCDGSYGCNFIDLETNVVGYTKEVSCYKVNHHGSRCSNNLTWISQAKSPVAVISSGKNGRYKHPREEVVQELEADSSLKKFFLTSSVNYYGRTLGTKGVLNPTAGQPVTLSVGRVNNAVPITTTSVFSVAGQFFTKP